MLNYKNYTKMIYKSDVYGTSVVTKALSMLQKQWLAGKVQLSDKQVTAMKVLLDVTLNSPVAKIELPTFYDDTDR